jgi:tRNA G18 (ribose-2'-O)-methylase SpoU
MPVVPVDDDDDGRLTDYRTVSDPLLLRERGVFVAESRLVVRELLAHPRFETCSLLVTEAALESLADLLEARDEDLPIYVGTRQFLRRIAGFDVHRGCLALGIRPARSADVSLPQLRTARRVVVLEDVGNPDNIGGIFRNALAFGVECVLLSPRCCDPLYRKAIRVSIGATLRLAFAYIDDWPAGLERLRAAGLTLVALTPESTATDIAELASHHPSRVALLLGTEGPGLSSTAKAWADLRVRIPLAAGTDSLNVATAAGIALHRLADAM